MAGNTIWDLCVEYDCTIYSRRDEYDGGLVYQIKLKKDLKNTFGFVIKFSLRDLILYRGVNLEDYMVSALKAELERLTH